MMTEPPNQITAAIRALSEGHSLSEDLAEASFTEIVLGEATPAQAAALLIGLRVRGESPDELAGVLRSLRSAMIPVHVTSHESLVDTCGTGGGAISTFNISTAAAFVAAGAGARVAKHGNRSFSSRCGSADVLAALGIDIALDADGVSHVLSETGIGFMFAPAFHPAMKNVAAVRRELRVGTIFNLAGPLANPASVKRQVVGVPDRSQGPLLAEVLRRAGAVHALVVHGVVGMDEISPSGESAVWEVTDGQISTWCVEPSSYGLEVSALEALQGGEPPENAARIRRLFEDPGSDQAGRAAVALNAGAAIYVAGVAPNYEEGIAMAISALESGDAAGSLERLTAVAPASTSA